MKYIVLLPFTNVTHRDGTRSCIWYQLMIFAMIPSSICSFNRVRPSLENVFENQFHHEDLQFNLERCRCGLSSFFKLSFTLTTFSFSLLGGRSLISSITGQNRLGQLQSSYNYYYYCKSSLSLSSSHCHSVPIFFPQ